MRLDRYDIAFGLFILTVAVGLLALILGNFVFGWFHGPTCSTGKHLIMLPAGKVLVPFCS